MPERRYLEHLDAIRERRARSRARVDLLAAARTANTLLRLHTADTGSEDYRLDEVQDPLPYRPVAAQPGDFRHTQSPNPGGRLPVRV